MQEAVVLARLTAFIAGVVLFGAPAFLLYSLDSEASARVPLKPWLIGASALVALSAAGSLAAQTASMAGDPQAGLDVSTLRDVLLDGGFGTSVLLRAFAGLCALVMALLLRPGHALWTGTSFFGALAVGAMAWSGHGAADQGAAGLIHTSADVAHLLAAGLWIGALFALSILLRSSQTQRSIATLHHALSGFAGVGSALVAALIATGLVNGWLLIGSHMNLLLRSPWGQLLMAKVVLFIFMLSLAALNRFRLVPELAVGLFEPSPSERALRLSIAVESGFGLAILALVAVLGTLEPPISLGFQG